jgi:hypothetical protein
MKSERDGRVPTSAVKAHAGGEPGSLKRYDKPVFTQVELRPEEAVLGNCKTAGIAGPGQPTCNQVSTCSAAGS